MSGKEDAEYSPPQKLLDFLEQPVPRQVDASMRDWFLAQYGYMDQRSFNVIAKSLYLLIAAATGLYFWAAFISRERCCYSFSGVFFVDLGNGLYVFMFLALVCYFIYRICRKAGRRASLVRALTNGALASGSITGMNAYVYRPYSLFSRVVHEAAFEYPGPEGKIAEGIFTAPNIDVAVALRVYQKQKRDILLLCNFDKTSTVVPLISRLKSGSLSGATSMKAVES